MTTIDQSTEENSIREEKLNDREKETHRYNKTTYFITNLVCFIQKGGLVWFGMKTWGFYSGTELWPIYPNTQYNTMQTLTLPLSVLQSACRLSKGNTMLLKSQQMQCARFSLVLSSTGGFRSTDHYFWGWGSVPLSRPGMSLCSTCNLSACRSGLHELTWTTALTRHVHRSLISCLPGGKKKKLFAVNLKHAAADRIKQGVGLSTCFLMSRTCGCHMMPSE